MIPYVADPDFTLLVGDVRDVLRELPDESVDCCVTSPPYWGLRCYGHDQQIGLEATPELYVQQMVEVFRQVRRVLTPSGTCWVNLGDSYNNRAKTRETSHQPALNGFEDDAWADRAARGGVRMSITDGQIKEKDLVGIPWRVAFALQQDGWYLRSDIVWSKPNPMPESVTDRPTKSHEYVFLLTKQPRYWFDAEAVREAFRGNGDDVLPHSHMRNRRTLANDLPPEAPRGPDGRRATQVNGSVGSIQHRDGERWPNGGRNVRSVWEIATQPYPDAHFATFPEALPERCIKAGCPPGGTVLDPFMGSGTVALVARRLGRRSVGVELNEEYAALCARRLQQLSLLAEELSA